MCHSPVANLTSPASATPVCTSDISVGILARFAWQLVCLLCSLPSPGALQVCILSYFALLLGCDQVAAPPRRIARCEGSDCSVEWSGSIQPKVDTSVKEGYELLCFMLVLWLPAWMLWKCAYERTRASCDSTVMLRAGLSFLLRARICIRALWCHHIPVHFTHNVQAFRLSVH